MKKQKDHAEDDPECPKMSPALENQKKEEAAVLLAEDHLTDARIADLVGVNRKTLQRWKELPDFSRRVQQVVGVFADRALKHGLARRERRLQVLNDMHDRMLQIIDERAKSPDLSGVPGGTTGLVTKQMKGIGKGDDFRIVEVYEVDTATLREIREMQAQVAEELGQKVKKVEMDISSSIEGRSNEELTFWLAHHHWPEDQCDCEAVKHVENHPR